MPSEWIKQPQQANGKYFNYGSNAGVGDSVLGGALTSLPAGVQASQGIQDSPGDRVIFGASDALAASNTAQGTLYEGMYMYVQLLATAPAAVVGNIAFWDPTAFSVANSIAPPPDNLYRVTSAEPTTTPALCGPVAGIFINPLAAGNWWWIQIAGKATVNFGTAANSQFGGNSTYLKYGGVYVGGYGSATGSNGKATQLGGTTAPTTSLILDQMVSSHLGIAETLPSAAGTAIVDLDFRVYRF